MTSETRCLDCAYKNNPISQGVLPERHRKDVQCNKEASYKRSAKLDPTFGNSDGESQVQVANVNIAKWLSAALTSLWMNQQHLEGLLLSPAFHSVFANVIVNTL